jgi:hypothetical protein
MLFLEYECCTFSFFSEEYRERNVFESDVCILEDVS